MKMFAMRIPSLLIATVSGLLFLISCGGDDTVSTDDEAYRTAVSDFYVSLAASQTEEARFAFNKMNDVATAFPQEPAAWANLGVMAMRQGNYELADERFEQARNRAPQNSSILFLSGIFESRQGNIDAAIDYMRSALEADPDNNRIRFALINELERQDDVSNAEEILTRIEDLFNEVPLNQAVQFETARIAAKERNTRLLREAVQAMAGNSDRWPEEARELFEVIESAAEEEEFSDLNFELTFLRNAVEPTPAFQADLRNIQLEPNQVGFLIDRFIVLPQPRFRAAEPDPGITYSDFQENNLPERSRFMKSATLLEDRPPFPLYMENNNLVLDEEVRLPMPVSADSDRISPNVMAEIDFNYNFRNDIAFAGSEGFMFYRQEEDQSFTDITSTLGLSANIINGSYHGVWPADVDLDGDLDLVLAARNDMPFALRNNSDGTFTRINLFDDMTEAVDFLWADLDDDGDSDALFLTGEGDTELYRNQRSSMFTSFADLPGTGNVNSFTVSDIDANGTFDILLLNKDGSVSRLEYDQDKDNWDLMPLINVEQAGTPAEPASIYSADIDNNGSLDIVISSLAGTDIWLSNSDIEFSRINGLDLPGGVTSVFDLSGNERLDFIGIDADGQIFQKVNSGTMNYNARFIRARASGPEGDQRINSFGIGGEMEIRTGLLYQKQLISSPIVHFGLGGFEEADMLRIIWPNGSVQAEFAELGMGSTIFNEQILKGSCPWLFTDSGEGMEFITDILWRSPLGLRINAQETAGVIQTLDRVRIPGDLLQPKDGLYDVRITAELWETHFFDHVSLVAVDHPTDSDIFVDERFVFPAPDLSTKAMTKPEPVTKVTDQNGFDWTETVSATDGSYMMPFEKTSYQGIVKDHFIEIELGDDIPANESLYLVASGWLRPTDSSINLAISQGDRQGPSGLRVEVSDGSGGWDMLHENYGVPAGKTKSILLDLDGAFTNADDRKVRLHTTSEIYWDSIRWAIAISSDQITETELVSKKMDLRYRGYSEWVREDSVSPMLPVYDEISSSHQRWRDLMGYHTRFGDVSELLGEIDDRYVIMNAGDEMQLEFEYPGEPAPGYTRSFVFVSDGWVKDGDYNTEASKTVTPLPFHGQTDYEYGTNRNLTEDPVYKRHKGDWVNFHTRFVTPDPFRTALLFDRE
ncbi:FG-GAP-like repeat-containing protein [Rhodohalobacter sp. 8-1]|uniref:FG-GAP-like repeat-containing protein n=1 Tax=Rhodohalobacter sp. 8-1 TaxID=3131972 RepID=UPI0030EC585D